MRMTFKVSMASCLISMVAMLAAVVMFVIERAAPGQAWVAAVGTTSIIVAVGAILSGLLAALVDVFSL